MDPNARIRTTGALPFQVALVDATGRPVYQEIARKALQLRELGLSDRTIAKRLGVSDKTVAKGIEWIVGRTP
jgi:DNA invertase Pin-like site-specific DNA recombinase